LGCGLGRASKKHEFNSISQVAPTCPHGRARWRHLANTILPSVCGSSVSSCQITLTTCCCCCCCQYFTQGIHRAVFWHHSCIVAMSGVCLSTPLSLVMERAALRCLSDYLRGHSPRPSQLINAAERIAQALLYLVCTSHSFNLSIIQWSKWHSHCKDQ